MAASTASTIAAAIMTTARREDVMPTGRGSPDPAALRDLDRRDPDPRGPALVGCVRGGPAGDGEARGRLAGGEAGPAGGRGPGPSDGGSR